MPKNVDVSLFIWYTKPHKIQLDWLCVIFISSTNACDRIFFTSHWKYINKCEMIKCNKNIIIFSFKMICINVKVEYNELRHG
jgi:hypothetical protein